ncbi:shikimate dehydrogenase family protein [Paracoccus methylarcula]|uniref:Shikimate dehydrogenase n=1 Tax=Paracoccus methylarcula TaxID=72022 RepID=A0A422QZ58_9RHOB|nr:shikimate dehydrogenase [Paracoccus methylarcula]RNF35266.1 shikimate dehydrogenase [Paracoccus methylarcula]
MISGHTRVIAHIGVPTESFKAPMIYNPWFEAMGIDTVVVPMGCETADFAGFLPLVARLRNFAGALVTMPHKVATVDLLDEASTAVRICGACNAVRRDPDGRLIGDMFDGEGFVRGAIRKGCEVAGASVLVVGTGGVGSAIAASLAGAGAARLDLYDINPASAERLASSLRKAYPEIEVTTGVNDPAGREIVVNATPMGMQEGDPMPLDVTRLDPGSFVGEVVMKREETAFLAAARGRGCRVQIGTDMLFEQIPAYLEFFGYPTTTAEELRQLATIRY